MNLLFVHQNFPGQFKHLAPHFARAGYGVQALAIDGAGLPGIPMRRYKPARSTAREAHPWAQEFETKVIRGEACAAAALQIRNAGFSPDVIVANPGWGESLFLKDVWPQAKMLALIEFFYGARGLDFDFDPEFHREDLARYARLRAKNAHLLMALADMDWGICPTEFQRSTVPAEFQAKTSVIFDGIDTTVVRPDPGASVTVSGRTLRAGDEVQDRLDASRVFFLGRLPYADYLRVLQVSACHVYLTYPFVLGWSCVEALAAGCLVVGSRTPPVEEAIAHGLNGRLVDFFDTGALAATVTECLGQPERFAALRQRARAIAVERYDLATVCLPRQIGLIQRLAAGKLD